MYLFIYLLLGSATVGTFPVTHPGSFPGSNECLEAFSGLPTASNTMNKVPISIRQTNYAFRTSMDFQGLPRDFTDFHGLPRTSKDL